MISTGRPWLHWPEDTAVQRGVWRDYYSGEKLEDYTKPWIRPRAGVYEPRASKCASIFTDDPVNASWWHGPCTTGGNIRGCPCTNEGTQPPLLSLRGLCPSSLLNTANPKIGLQFTPVQPPHDLKNVWFQGGMSSKIYFNSTQWIIKDDVQNVTAVSKAAKYSFALGKHQWWVTNQ